MRQLGYHRDHKHIYNIYFEIKKVQLIPLTINDIEKLIIKFISVEREFKKFYPSKNNLLSYNIVIYCILKKYNHSYYKNVILPKNKKKLLKNIENLV